MSQTLIDAVGRLYAEDEVDPFDPVRPQTALALVREAVSNLGWGWMTYECEKCGFVWKVWLSLGVEGPPELREAKLYLPAPFTTRCPAWPNMQVCDGTMRHVRWNEDTEFPARLIPDDAPRFVLPYQAHRGDRGGHLEIPEQALIAARQAMNEQRDDFPGAT